MYRCAGLGIPYTSPPYGYECALRIYNDMQGFGKNGWPGGFYPGGAEDIIIKKK